MRCAHVYLFLAGEIIVIMKNFLRCHDFHAPCECRSLTTLSNVKFLTASSDTATSHAARSHSGSPPGTCAFSCGVGCAGKASAEGNEATRTPSCATTTTTRNAPRFRSPKLRKDPRWKRRLRESATMMKRSSSCSCLSGMSSNHKNVSASPVIE